MNFEEWPYHTSKLPADFLERTNFFNKLEKDIESELRENPEKYQSFYEGYDPNSIDNFITQYAKHKRYLIEHYEWNLDRLETCKELRYREKTEQVFHVIRQKKLFNMQLLWRAEQLELPDIDLCTHFEYWGRNIEKCSFIQPVNEAEVDMMKQFLRSNYGLEELLQYSGWQNYEEITAKDENGDYENMPAWYEFYDGMMGTGSLLLLPDIRGAKEEEYAELGREKWRKDMAANPVQNHYVPPPPMLNPFNEEMARFVHTFEDEYIQTLSLGYEKMFVEEAKSHVPAYNIEEIEEAIYLLDEADYPVIMDGGMDWREAIIHCAEKYMSNIISEELGIVFAEYEMFQSMGIGHSMADCRVEYAKEGICDIWSNLILDGREQKGEPRDFNF